MLCSVATCICSCYHVTDVINNKQLLLVVYKQTELTDAHSSIKHLYQQYYFTDSTLKWLILQILSYAMKI